MRRCVQCGATLPRMASERYEQVVHELDGVWDATISYFVCRKCGDRYMVVDAVRRDDTSVVTGAGSEAAQ